VAQVIAQRGLRGEANANCSSNTTRGAAENARTVAAVTHRAGAWGELDDLTTQATLRDDLRHIRNGGVRTFAGEPGANALRESG
jgi:hypothetical protein